VASEPQTTKHQAEREFGFIVGGVFAALAAWWLLRGKFQFIAPGLLAAGIALVLLAIVFPKALRMPNRLWMMLADVLSFVMTRVILA
jgi:hypothetical protein